MEKEGKISKFVDAKSIAQIFKEGREQNIAAPESKGSKEQNRPNSSSHAAPVPVKSGQSTLKRKSDAVDPTKCKNAEDVSNKITETDDSEISVVSVFTNVDKTKKAIVDKQVNLIPKTPAVSKGNVNRRRTFSDAPPVECYGTSSNNNSSKTPASGIKAVVGNAAANTVTMTSANITGAGKIVLDVKYQKSDVPDTESTSEKTAAESTVSVNSSLAASSIKRTFMMPASVPKYIGTSDTKIERFVEGFLDHYFILFDSSDRSMLEDLYHEESLFSLTTFHVPSQETSWKSR